MQVGEGRGELVHPFDLQNRVPLTPEDPRRYVDWRQVRNLALPDQASSGAVSEVPVETALEVAGLHEVVDEALKVLVEDVGVRSPMTQEMADVEPTGLSR